MKFLTLCVWDVMAVASRQSYGNITPTELAQQEGFSRSLKQVRSADQVKRQNEQQHVEKIAEEMKNVPRKKPNTESQKRQSLKSQQRLGARLKSARRRNKAIGRITARSHRIIVQYGRTPWTVLYVAAASDALFDVLTIPIISTIASFCTSLYINVRMWNIGGKKGRAKRRIIRASASTLDLIPIINIVPISIIIVHKTKEDERKRMRRAKDRIRKLEKR